MMLFALLFPRRPVKPSRRKPSRRLFESLEGRYVLSSAPIIDFVQASVDSGQTVTISGHVMDDDPNAGALSVALSGPLQANVPVDSGGNFSYTASASSLSDVQAVATDAGTGLDSGTATASIPNDAPQIMFWVSQTGDGKNVVISGCVMDESPGGLTVNFSGVASGSVTTDSGGGFTLNATASALGNVTATTSDVWGVESPATDSPLASDAPSVYLWSDVTGPNQQITVWGQVSAGAPGNATVTISGVVSGTVTTDEYGYFSLTAIASGKGEVSATATDVWGQTSSASSTMVIGSEPAVTSLCAYASYDENQAFEGWRLTGTINDFMGSFTIVVSGLASGTYSYTYNQQTGNTFSLLLPIAEDAEGEISVVVTNCWGNDSDSVSTWIMSM